MTAFEVQITVRNWRNGFLPEEGHSSKARASACGQEP